MNIKFAMNNEGIGLGVYFTPPVCTICPQDPQLKRHGVWYLCIDLILFCILINNIPKQK